LLGIKYDTIEDAEAAVAKAKEEWKQMKIKGAERREKKLLDYHPVEFCKEDDKMIKKKKKILSRIKRTLSQNHTFQYLSRYVGKGQRDSVKRFYKVDNNQKIIETYVDRDSIKKALRMHNTQHFKQAHQLIAYKDKIYKKLERDKIRDKVLNKNIRKEDCNDNRIY